MEVLTTLHELELSLREAEHKRSISDDAFRESLSRWYLSSDLFGEIPDDPSGPEFRAYQLRIYQCLAAREYEVTNEQTTFDFEREIECPYPYGTRSAETVGNHLVGYGWLIKVLNLPPASRILEIGSGFGALTVHLAAMGYRVTCLDISWELLEFVRARTASLSQPVDTICGDMATAQIEGTFDAVIFNASLHHSLEHRAVIQRLDDILAPKGIVAFAAEPVVPDDSLYVPYPWGIRLDGLSVWSVSKWGWLELGFQESYFVHLLREAGYRLRRYDLGLSGNTDVWVASETNRACSRSVAYPGPAEYDSDLESEVIRLRELVRRYESGRFIRFMKWLKRHVHLPLIA